MYSRNELNQNILLSYHNTHGKKSRIHQKTYFLAKKRVVVHQCTVTRLRFWNLLPPKETTEKSILQIPDSVTTEAMLYSYVRKHRRSWLRGSL